MTLSPPPDEMYASRSDLLTAVRAWASFHGYALVIARSDQHRLTLKCDRGGAYRDKRNLTEDVRQRATGSRLIGCPFMATGSESRGQWWFSVRMPEHNHDPSSSAIQHPSLRRLNQEQKHQIEMLSRVGAPLYTILAAVQEKLPGGQAITSQDVYNARTQLREEVLVS